MFRRLLTYLFAFRTEPLSESENRRSHLRFEFLDGVVLALYTCVLSLAIHHHRPWIDEAQAWLLARDTSMRDLLLRRLHYEGAPALWHTLLKCAIGLHLPYAGLNWIGGAFAVAGIFVFLRYSPFPRIFRWLLPFTFYLQYQYAVVARPYVLYPLLVFTLCIVYSLRKPRPILFALIAGILANINAHVAILSCVFAVLYLAERYRHRQNATPKLRRNLLVAACLFVSFCAASVVVAFPAPDAMVVPVATGKVKKANPFLVRLIPPEVMPVSAPALDAPLTPVDPTQVPGSTPAAAAGTPDPTFAQRVVRKAKHTVRISADVAVFPVAESNLLGVGFLLLFGLWLWRRNGTRFALPWLVTVPAAAYIWVYDHHTGIFAVALIAAAWLSLEQPHAGRPSKVLSTAFGAAALLVVLLQIGWSVHTIRAEAHHQYDAGEETEAFLERHYRGKSIAGFGFQTVSVQPYADHNLFSNWDRSYWLWSNVNPIDLRRTEALDRHPDVVVVADLTQERDSLYNQWGDRAAAGVHPSGEMVLFWQEHGYRETHRFCGTRYMRAGDDNILCELILEPDRPSLAP